MFSTIVKPNYVKLLPSIKISKNTKIEKKILKEQKAPKIHKNIKNFEIGAKTKNEPPKKKETIKIQNRNLKAKIKVLSTFFTKPGRNQIILFQVESTCININSRDHATLVKGTGGKRKSENGRPETQNRF